MGTTDKWDGVGGQELTFILISFLALNENCHLLIEPEVTLFPGLRCYLYRGLCDKGTFFLREMTSGLDPYLHFSLDEETIG